MENQENFYTAIGKRKTSVAKVFLKKGSGEITINQKNFEDFFSSLAQEREKIKKPFLVTDLENQYDVIVFVKGGGLSSQMDAICLALSKSICLINNTYRSILNKNFFLRRDSRIKERRKYGLKKARKASQYSKR
jgi:small subunit ribosomal protein S9